MESVRSNAAVEVGGVLGVGEVDEERCSGDCEADIVVGEEGGETNGDEVRERRARDEGIFVAVDTMRGDRGRQVVVDDAGSRDVCCRLREERSDADGELVMTYDR